MKRIISALLFGALFLSLLGCVSILPDGEQLPAGKSVAIYRVAVSGENNTSDLIRAEDSLNLLSGEPDPDTVLALFLSPGDDPSLKCPVPEGVTVEGWSMDNGVMTVTFSENLLELSELERTLAAFCTMLTICQLDSVEAVTVMAGTKTLFSGLIPEDALLRDTDTDTYARQLRLYFADRNGRYLISEYHSLTLDEDASAERYVLEELLRGPNSGELRSPVPAGTALLSCSTVDGICTVDLSRAFVDNRAGTALEERLAIYSIVDSLTALSAIDSVVILVEGQPLDTYAFRSLGEPVPRYEEVIGPVAVTNEELDGDIYLPLPEQNALARLPLRVRGLSCEDRAENVLTALIGGSEPGYPALFTGSASVVSLSLRSGICTVGLSEGFLPSLAPENRSLAMHSIAATLCSLEEISAVKFTVNGQDAAVDGTDWSGPWYGAGDIEVY